MPYNRLDQLLERTFEWPYREGLIRSARLRLDRNSDFYSEWETYFGEPPQRRFQSQNHRFYIGKSFTAQEEKALWGSTPIYGKDNITGLLSILFDHLESGQQAQLLICPEFSEWFNGQQRGPVPMSPEEQKTWIYSIAWKKFKKGPDALNVISIGEDPLHTSLVETIRQTRHPETGVCDVQKAFSVEHPVCLEEIDSLTIARFLFSTARQNPSFRGALYGTLPSKAKGPQWHRVPFDQLDESKQIEQIAYPLTELSIRISDLLAGCEFQGGVDRQSRYDELVAELFNASTGKGRFRKLKVLAPLTKLLSRTRFTGVYLNQESNYFPKRKQQVEAQVRLGVYGLLGAAALGGAVWIGGFEQRAIERRQEDYLDTCLALKMPKLSEPDRRSSFEETTKVVRDELAYRYSQPYYLNDAVMAGFTDYYCNGSRNYDSLDRVSLQDDVDDFAASHAFLITTNGGHPGAPYAYFDRYKDTFRQFLTVDTSKEEDVYSSSIQTRLTYLGGILDRDGNLISISQDMYRPQEMYTDYVRPPVLRESYQPSSEPTIYYSPSRAQGFIQELIAIRERFTARQVAPFFDSAHWDFNNTALPSLTVDCDTDSAACRHRFSYPGFLGPEFDLALYHSDENTMSWTPIARKTGETLYSYSTALEASQRYYTYSPHSAPH